MPNRKSSILIILILVISSITLTASSQSKAKFKYDIKGKVTQDSFPLINVNIVIKNTGIGTKTNKFGEYSINVIAGDTLQFTHIGFSTVTLKLEGNEKIINVEMFPESYILEEAELKTVKSNITFEENEKAFSTSKENINPRSVGYRTSYVDEDFSSYVSLTSALLARVPSYQVKLAPNGNSMGFIRGLPVLWDVDGYVTDVEPVLIIENIKNIRVLGSAAAVNYGMRCKGLGGVGDMRSCGAVIKITMKKNFKKEPTPKEKKRMNKLLDSIQNTFRKKNEN